MSAAVAPRRFFRSPYSSRRSGLVRKVYLVVRGGDLYEHIIRQNADPVTGGTWSITNRGCWTVNEDGTPNTAHSLNPVPLFLISNDYKGTLKNGKLADLAVLSQDIFTAPPETLGKTQVLMTFVGGKSVYAAAP